MDDSLNAVKTFTFKLKSSEAEGHRDDIGEFFTLLGEFLFSRHHHGGDDLF